MPSSFRSLLALALLTSCYTDVPCEWTITGVTPTEVTPLGFSPADAASALAANETLTLTYADGTPAELEVSTEVILIEDPGGGGRPPIPNVTVRRAADGMEHPSLCEGTEVRVGNIETRIVSSDGRIDERWTDPLTLFDALPGTTVTLTSSPDTPGGTWSPPRTSINTRAVFEVSVTVGEGGFARITHVSALGRSRPDLKGPPVDEPLVTYDAP